MGITNLILNKQWQCQLIWQCPSRECEVKSETVVNEQKIWRSLQISGTVLQNWKLPLTQAFGLLPLTLLKQSILCGWKAKRLSRATLTGCAIDLRIAPDLLLIHSWDLNLWFCIRIACFKQQQGCFGVFCETIGNNTARWAGANHDLIVLSHDIFLLCCL